MAAKTPGAADARFYLAYLTANDSQRYQADFLHFRHMTRLHPGVARIAVYIAVSAVRPFSAIDRAALDALVQMADACPWLELRRVVWKGNVGRDFSSAEACLRAIGEDARPSDFVMVRNRSAYGPSRAGWYGAYVDQYARFASTGLVGSTINFSGHPKKPTQAPTTHVQTYAYLSQWRHFEPLAAAYPAARCVDRTELIDAGEIGLSRALLAQGLGLSCLQWPNELFTASRPTAPHLPQQDIKKHAREVPLRYKYRAYLRHPRDLRAQLGWAVQLAASVRNAAPPQSAGRHVLLNDYDPAI
jgi:hypothetical protein